MAQGNVSRKHEDVCVRCSIPQGNNQCRGAIYTEGWYCEYCHERYPRYVKALNAYLTSNNRIFDAARRVIGTYRWLATGRIVALIDGQVYAGMVEREEMCQRNNHHDDNLLAE